MNFLHHIISNTSLNDFSSCQEKESFCSISFFCILIVCIQRSFSLSVMSIGNISNDGADSQFVNAEVSIPRIVRFWLMLLANIPSIICSFCLIIYIITNRVQRYALHNHTILLILLFGLPIQLIDINFYLIFFHFTLGVK